MFINESKKLHIKNEKKKVWRGLFDPNYPDTQRHWLMLRSSLKAVQTCNPSSLMTVGDSTGRDAAFFKRYLYSNPKVISSDLEASHLEAVKEMGFIDNFIDCDVEKIPYPDDSIDVIVGKETFHHWPRPMLGLYECLRVAKKLVIFIEPHDIQKNNFKPPYPIGNEYINSYERIGNYKYAISIREFEKVVSSLYLPGLVLKGLNDPYKKNQKFEDYKKQSIRLDKMAENGERHFNLITIGIPKDEKTLSDIKKIGEYNCINRTPNPYKELN